MENLVKEHFIIETEKDFEKARTLLTPIQDWVNEKIENNMYDDWNEFEHNVEWLEQIKKSILNKSGDILYAYDLRDNKDVVGVCFVLAGKNSINNFLKSSDIDELNEKSDVCKLGPFHIMRQYRGIGRKMLENYVFPDLQKKGLHTVYIKSSHNKALSLYDRLGERVGTYIGISDNKLYQRLGYIFKIKI